MWRDISNDVRLLGHDIVDGNRKVGIIKKGIIGVFVEGYRVRLEREYDNEGFVNKFFIEKDMSLGEMRDRAWKPQQNKVSIPIARVPNMRFLELKLMQKELFVNVEQVESFQRKGGNISIVKMVSGEKYEVDYDVQRIRQKIEGLEQPAQPPA